MGFAAFPFSFFFPDSLFLAGARGRSDEAKVSGTEAEKMKAEEDREAGKQAEEEHWEQGGGGAR